MKEMFKITDIYKDKFKIIDIYKEVYDSALAGVNEAMKRLELCYMDTKIGYKRAFAPTPKMRTLMHTFSEAMTAAIKEFCLACGYDPDAPDDDEDEENVEE